MRGIQKILEVVVFWQCCIHFLPQFLAYLLYIDHFLSSDYLYLCLQTRDCYWCASYFLCLSVQLLSLIFIRVPVVKFTFRINILDLPCFVSMVWYLDCEASGKLGQLFSASFIWEFCKMSESGLLWVMGFRHESILNANLLTGLVSLIRWISSYLTMIAKVLYYLILLFSL